MITLEILDYNKKFVKQWPWEDREPIPNKGDTIVLRYGEHKEKECHANVLYREFYRGFDGTVIRIITDYVESYEK